MSLPGLDLWLVVGSVGAALGALFLVWYLSRHRGKPGANWFVVTLIAVAAFCGSYGVSLLVFDPQLRAALEMWTFVSLCFIGPAFLAFGLDYTGRPDIVRSPIFAAVAAVPLLTVALGVTNSTHGLIWTDFRLDPVFGASTVQYTLQSWGLFAVLFGMAATTVGLSLLVGTILGYGPLYRREATAVALSTVPPTIGLLLWLSELGPVPQLNLMPVLMLPHLALDAYAFVGTAMFETNPTTQRAAERSALDDLSEPLLVLDTREQVVNLNDRTKSLFDVQNQSTLPVPFAEFTGTDLESLRSRGELEIDGTEGGTFAVSFTPLTDPRGEAVGSMVVLYDVTEQRRRKQQLSVLNRVFRHNLRNEMTLVRGHADWIESNAADPQLASQAETIVEASDRLLSIGEKVRQFARLQERTPERQPVDVATVLEDIDRQLGSEYPEATIEAEVATDRSQIRTDPQLLRPILSNLLENAIVHAAEGDPTVNIRVRSAESDTTTVFEVRDDNPQIPDIEITSLEGSEETPLQHGRGIGLWIVNWCVNALDGTVEFTYDDGNVVTVTLPETDAP